MPNSPLIIRALTAVQGLTFFVDGFPDRQHKLSSRIGDEPLEDGRSAVDHVVKAPTSVVLTGIVSDFRGTARVEAAWKAIEELHAKEEPVRVVTEWQVYDEMVIKRCDGVPVGRGLRFELELRQILRVSGSTGPAVPAAAQSGVASARAGEVSRGRVPLVIPPLISPLEQEVRRFQRALG